MKVLVVGGGGREHAMAWRVARDPGVQQVHAVPGNAGMQEEFTCKPGNILNIKEIAAMAESLQADCTVVGPEAPLVAGIVDEFESRGLAIVGPTRAAARLEGSKAFAKDFLAECGLPTASSVVLDDVRKVDATVGRFGYPVALKADGLAAGKGVVIAADEAQARAAARAMLTGRLVGAAGRRILVEQFLRGEEVSFMVLSDGQRHCTLPVTQDHKRALDGDQGPNTGGMGAYSDDTIIDAAMQARIVDTIVEPALAGMRRRGMPFKGFLYCGLMLTADGPQVLEFNVRLGDPETQALLYRLRGGFAELLAGAARGALDPSLVSADPQPTACVVLASQGYPGSYPTGLPITGLEDAEDLGAKIFHAGTMLEGGVPVTSGGRVLGVTARGAVPSVAHQAKSDTLPGLQAGEGLGAALDLAYQAAAAIHFDGVQYRRDIGRRGLQRAAAGN